jgi:hypothetical protein
MSLPLAFLWVLWVNIRVVLHYIGKLLFPNEQRSARRRKMRILCITVLGALLASGLIAALYVWVYSSGRF